MLSTNFRHHSGWPMMASKFDNMLMYGLADHLGAGLAMTKAPVNIIDQSDRYVIELAQVGLDKESFHIETKERQLSIQVTKMAKNESVDDKEYIIKEFDQMSYTKEFNLPEDADVQNISATYVDGVLTVSISKLSATDQTWSRRISIQ